MAAVPHDFDIAILGSGFAGSLMATILAKQGHRVVLLEQGRHPRFAIGESSTPLANLLLEQLADRYGLEALRPLCKWGTWQKSLPGVACGLKRGFTFLKHRPGRHWRDDVTHADSLLVAASPRDAIGDTHWYRPEFDQFLVREAVSAGVEYLDEWQPRELVLDGNGGEIHGARQGKASMVGFRWLVDATGGSRFVPERIGIRRGGFPEMPATRTVYAHFEGVRRCEDLLGLTAPPPYPVDDAAVHHLFDDGWIWVLRFNNGLTSAGCIVRDGADSGLGLGQRDGNGEALWRSVLARYPTVAEQFAGSRAVMPFRGGSPVAFRMSQAAFGPCILLPSACGFVDPMFSTGFPLTLLGIQMLAAVFEPRAAEGESGGEEIRRGLAAYERETLGNLDATAGFVGACFRVFSDFDSFRSMSMLYFAAAIHAETSRRLGADGAGHGFLLRRHPGFGPGLARCCDMAGRVPPGELATAVKSVIEPVDLGGLLDPGCKNWYAAELAPMLEGAGKVGATRESMLGMLERAGFLNAAGS